MEHYTRCTGRTSYLLGLSGSQSLESYRLETQSRLGVNQTLSLAGTVDQRHHRFTSVQTTGVTAKQWPSDQHVQTKEHTPGNLTPLHDYMEKILDQKVKTKPTSARYKDINLQPLLIQGRQTTRTREPHSVTWRRYWTIQCKQTKRDTGKLNPQEVGKYWTIEEHKNLHQQGTRTSVCSH